MGTSCIFSWLGNRALLGIIEYGTGTAATSGKTPHTFGYFCYTLPFTFSSHFCALHRKPELYFRNYFNPLCCHLLAYSLVLLIMWSINWITDRGVAIFRRKTIIFLPQKCSLNWFLTFFATNIVLEKFGRGHLWSILLK